MAASVITATGVPTTPGPNGSIPLRREIRDLQSNFPDQWNLYLLGLTDFCLKSPTDLLSYYQLAGIHGEPYVPWNDVQGDENATFGGYCTHSSILFLTWHRPYLAIYEQALYASVQDVAAKFPEALRARYTAAAKDFRMPYWDWAIRITGQTSAFPSAISSKTATVVDVDGVSKQIRNPLYSFRFDDKQIPQDLAVDGNWSRFTETKRAPNRAGNSQDALVSRVITNEAASLRNNVSLALLSYKQFDAFSNNAWLRNGTPGQYGSLEDIHNEIHDKIGQGGHMGSLEVSSFDPVFWLHHTNVDRLWGIWQALNPNAYVIDKTAQAQEANFTIAAGTRITAATELKPFYDSSATRFWDSNGVKYTPPFGHAYPETQRWLYPTDQAYQTAVRNQATKLYGANVISNFFSSLAVTRSNASASDSSVKIASSKTAPHTDTSNNPFLNANVIGTTVAQAFQPALDSEQQPIKASAVQVPAEDVNPKAESAQSAPLNIPSEFAHIVTNNTYPEWITNLRTIKHALNQTFRVYVFLGDFNPDPSTWPTEHNVVGRFTVLGRSASTGCEKCHIDRDNELVVTGTVPLTSALLQDIVEGRLASLEKGDVEPYLERHLHWRVTVFDGSEKARDEVPGLKVGVVSTRVTIGEDGLPIYSEDYETHTGITDGRPAGFCEGDEI